MNEMNQSLKIMKKNTALLLILLFLYPLLNAQEIDRSQPPQAGPAPRINLGEVEHFTLDNGLKVIVVENHKLPRVSFQLRLNNDPIFEGDKAGYISMAGDLLRSGTTLHSKQEIDESIDFIGGSLSTYSNGMFGSCLTRHTETLLSIMSEVLLHPVFPQAELEKSRKQTLTALQTTRDDPGTMAENVAGVLRYGADNPYGEIVTEETVSAITRDDLVEYYNTYFRPNVAYLVVVGDITADMARDLAERYFGPWEASDVPKHSYSFPSAPAGNRVAFVNKPGAVQSVIEVTYPIPLKPGSPEAIPASITNNILGGGVFSGRLMQNLRETHAYTYGATSSISSDKLMGEFSASTSVRNAVTDSAIVQILYEMNRMRNEEVDEDHLQLVKNVMSGNFARSLESPQTVAAFALNTMLYDLPEDYYATYLEKVAAVTPAQVKEMADRYILPEQSYIVVVGNKEEVAPKLEQFTTSGVEFYDPFGKPVVEEKPLPAGLTAQKVIDRYLEAIGGRKRLGKVKNLTIRMTTELQGMPIDAVTHQQAPDKFSMTMTMNGMPVMKQIYDGERGVLNAMQQKREMEGESLEHMKEVSRINPELKFEELGYRLELTGRETINGTDCYRVKITSPSGLESTEYFSVETGFRTRRVVVSGENTQVNDYADYREVNGIYYPFEMTTSLGPQTLKMKVQEVDNKTKIDAAEFVIE